MTGKRRRRAVALRCKRHWRGRLSVSDDASGARRRADPRSVLDRLFGLRDVAVAGAAGAWFAHGPSRGEAKRIGARIRRSSGVGCAGRLRRWGDGASLRRRTAAPPGNPLPLTAPAINLFMGRASGAADRMKGGRC